MFWPDALFKAVRLTVAAVTQVCLAVACLALSMVCWLFSRVHHRYYKELASYYFHKAPHQLGCYMQFGKQLIHLSWNRPFPIKERPGSTGLELLAAVAGQGELAFWQRFTVEGRAIDADRLKLDKEGCCLGMSLDFLGFYLRKVRAGLTPEEAIRSFGQRHADGPPVAAHLSQLFYLAAFYSAACHVGVEAQMETFFQKQQSELKQWQQEQNIALQGLPLSQREAFLAQMQVLFKAKMEAMEKDAREMAIKKTLSLNRKAIAAHLGLRLERAHLIDLRTQKSMGQSLADSMRALPAGSYFVSLKYDDRKGHAIALIKTQRTCHFQDPNIGTLEGQPDQLAAQLDKFYRKNKVTAIELVTCQLAAGSSL